MHETQQYFWELIVVGLNDLYLQLRLRVPIVGCENHVVESRNGSSILGIVH